MRCGGVIIWGIGFGQGLKDKVLILMVGSFDVECGDENGGTVTCVFVVEIGRKS
ncbi:hypothetical protein AgCh_000911, partial [Apium graveolens]